jgi:hypothetical protein
LSFLFERFLSSHCVKLSLRAFDHPPPTPTTITTIHQTLCRRRSSLNPLGLNPSTPRTPSLRTPLLHDDDAIYTDRDSFGSIVRNAVLSFTIRERAQIIYRKHSIPFQNLISGSVTSWRSSLRHLLLGRCHSSWLSSCEQTGIGSRPYVLRHNPSEKPLRD